MNGHAAETYMSTYVLKDALERAGSTDRKKLVMLWPKQSYAGIRTSCLTTASVSTRPASHPRPS